MSEHHTEGRLGRWLVIAACVVVVATVVAAIGVMRSPSAQREVNLDHKRVDDLARIVQVVDLYVESHDALPPDLATLASQPGQWLSIADPVDGTPYTYEVTDERTFRLCAVFATDTAETRNGGEPRAVDGWNHSAGRQCFDRSAAEKSRRDGRG